MKPLGFHPYFFTFFHSQKMGYSRNILKTHRRPLNCTLSPSHKNARLFQDQYDYSKAKIYGNVKGIRLEMNIYCRTVKKEMIFRCLK